jgi:hypothetical protein
MRRAKIHLETTMFNYFFDTDRGEMHIGTVALFDEIQAGKYEAYTSTYVTDELGLADEPKRSEMLALIGEYRIDLIGDSEEARQLADVYVNESVVPDKYRYDGLHIACATVNDLDYVFSFNFKHINRVKTKTMTSIINTREGYRQIIIALPMEVIDSEDE